MESTFAVSDPLNDDTVLSKWGFEKNYCFRCKKKNSDVNGLLMQCAMCKKAYYCSMECFNADLEAHQKVCGTDELEITEPDRAAASEFDVASMCSSKNSKKMKKKKNGPDSPTKKNKNKKAKDNSNDNNDGDESNNDIFKIGAITLENDGQGGGGGGGADGTGTGLGGSYNGLAANGGGGFDPNTSDMSMDFDPNSSARSGGAFRGTNDDDDDSEYSEDEDGVKRKTMGRNTVRPQDGPSSSSLGRHFTVGVNYIEADGEVRDRTEARKKQLEEERKFLERSLSSLSSIVINENKEEYTWQKPDWANNSPLRKTKNGSKLRSGKDVTRPITILDRGSDHDDGN